MGTVEKVERAVDFSLPDSDGGVVTLSDYRSRWVVLYFYPSDNTSGCTKEAVDFSQLRGEFLKENCEIMHAQRVLETLVSINSQSSA